MSDLVERLREGVEWDESGPQTLLAERVMGQAADRIQQLEQRIAKAESALELIATPKRPDGTWNRDREACRVLAAEALEAMK